MYGMSRGVLNNNPLNIRLSHQTFEGEITPSKDTSFKQFDTALHGIRAGAKILGNYYKLHGLSTIAQIISRWAPSNENDTNSYIADVCKLMAVGPIDHLNVLDASILEKLITAIIWHENGVQPYSDSEISTAVGLAFPLS